MLGGGLVPGSLVLLGGSPGIGKSTLTGMALGNLGAAGHRVLYVSGEESTAQVRLRAERLGEAALAVPALAETSLEAVLATLEAERPDACVIDSVQTLHAEGMSRGAGVGGPGARGGERGDGAREAARLRGDPGRPRDQGGRGRRPAGARAPRRLRALLRGRARAQLPHPAGAQEPLRRDQRGRRIRDALRRSDRGRSTPRRGSSARRAPHPARSCSARWRGRGRCWSRSRRWSPRPRSSRRGGWPPGSIATGWRWCSRSSPVTAGRRWRAPTSSSTSPEACGSRSRGPTSRWRWRSHPRIAVSR